ncbi:major facilitator superfamily domain-containing protein, partial [Boletus coccyginus]
RSRTCTVVLVATCTIAMVVNASNITSVSIALPGIGRAIDIREDQLQWLLSTYFLSAGCLSLFYERVADLYGHKRVFLLGIIWQAGFALGCGFSSNVITLLVLRGLQGTGMAAAIPSALGVLARSFPPSRARSVAFAIFAAGASVGAALGMTIGGALTELITERWRSPFFFSAALSALCLIGGLISFDRDMPKACRRVDLIGATLLTYGLVLTVFALGQGPVAGWKTPYIISCLVAGVILVGIFPLWERHLEKAQDNTKERGSIRTPPLIKPSLWTRARCRSAVILAIAFLSQGGFMCWVLWVQLYYQYYLQLSPLRAVVRFIPMLVTDLLCYFFTPILVAKVPLVVLVTSGALGTGVACVLFALIDPSATYWVFSFSSTVLVVIGTDLVHLAGASFTAEITKPGEQNLFLNMGQIGAAFGLVVSTIVFNSVVNRQSAELGIVANATESNLPTLVELQGYRAAQWTGAGFSFLAALLAVIFLRGIGTV